MGFNSFHNSTPNPAQRYYKWSGGAKEITLPDGSTAKQPKGEVLFYNGEEMEKQPLPFKFCALEQTSSVTGYSPTPGSRVRYFSNEITSFDEVIRISRQDDNGTEVILEGKYQEVKDKLPQGAKYQTNLYIYNPEAQRIERFNISGSCLSAWIDFGKKNKGIYEHLISIEPGEKKTTGSVDYIAPKFTLCEAYGDDEMKLLVEQDKIVTDYLKAKRQANLELAGNGSVDAGIDQTPRAYDGEGSQERGSTKPQNAQESASDGEIDLSDIPF